MIRIIVSCLAIISVAAACENSTDPIFGFPGGGGGAVTQADASGTWSLTLTQTSTLACTGGALANGSIIPVNLIVQSDGAAASTSSWRSATSGALLPLSGSVRFTDGFTDLILTSGGSTGMELRGTITTNGTFSGTLTDPAPGFTPVYGAGGCEYNAPGTKS
ncbi:MAG TPA: hypothetical protein VJ865_08090 [Gemmatimonadaceae bacterium]|nr:hypothetical protein [Gemmatimonadaceae bacterium]